MIRQLAQGVHPRGNGTKNQIIHPARGNAQQVIWKLSQWTQDGKKMSRSLTLQNSTVKGSSGVCVKGCDGLDVNVVIWGLFMSTTLEAAVHLGTNYLENLHASRNQQGRTMQQIAIQRLSKVDSQSDGN